MKSNLDLERLDEVVSLAKEIYQWLTGKDHPEKYANAKNLEETQDFVHTLDLLETVLTRFAISAHFARIALDQLEHPAQPGSLGWEFWQIDIEEYLATNLLELCYQLSNAWKTLQGFATRDKTYAILKKKYQGPSDIILARHKATHLQPDEFEDHQVAHQYSILRRPYRIVDGKLQKELAKDTMPRVAALLHDTIVETVDYLKQFREATVGKN
jgi:hypothetical protein